MGYSISWLALKDKSPEALHQEFGFTTTGITGDYSNFSLCGCALPNGWYLLLAKGCEHKIISDSVLALVSRGCSVVACSVEEHVMFSSVAFWKDGKKEWSIVHKGGDIGLMDLNYEGSPPSVFNELREYYFFKQNSEGGKKAEVDYIFEIPLAVAKSLVGFKHDDDELSGDFEIFKPKKDSLLRPWWRFW